MKMMIGQGLPRLRGILLLAGLLTTTQLPAQEAERRTFFERGDAPRENLQAAGGGAAASGAGQMPMTRTRALLDAQRNGAQASTNEQYLSGPVQQAIWERYLESFTRSIPDTFISDSFSSEGE